MGRWDIQTSQYHLWDNAFACWYLRWWTNIFAQMLARFDRSILRFLYHRLIELALALLALFVSLYFSRHLPFHIYWFMRIRFFFCFYFHIALYMTSLRCRLHLLGRCGSLLVAPIYTFMVVGLTVSDPCLRQGFVALALRHIYIELSFDFCSFRFGSSSYFPHDG